VVVDDGSTDETPRRLAEIDDPRVRVLRHEQGRGVGAARNKGLREARCEWVSFLDDDDLWAPRKLRIQLDTLAASGADFCYGEAVSLDVENGVVMRDQPARDPDDLHTLLLEGNVLPGGCSNVLARTDVVRATGGFDERLSMVADWDMWLRLAERGRGVACHEVVVAYRKHSENMSGPQGFAKKYEELEYFVSKQRRERGGEFDVRGYAGWLADSAPSPLQAARVHWLVGRAYGSPREAVRAAGALLGARVVKRAAERGRAAIRAARGRTWAIAAPDWLEPYRRTRGS
jgi:glycosyltransferase involved in cell wall biosynthesis